MALIGPMKYLTIGGSTYEIQGQEITSSAITTALGYTPYNGSTNPNGYISSFTDVNVTSTAVTGATTNYITGSTTSSTTTGTLSKHASASIYTTADSGTGGYAELRLGNATNNTTAGGKYGQIRLYGSGATYYTTVKAGQPSSNNTLTLPTSAGTVALTSDIPDVSGKIDTAGTGLSKSGTTLNHSNSVTAQTTQAIYPIKIDAQGHISAYGTAVTPLTASSTLDATKLSGTIPSGCYTDNDTKVSTAAVTSGTTYYPTVGSDSTSAATKYYDKTGFAYKATNGTANGTNGQASITLGNNTASTTANWKQGKVILYGTTAYATTIVAGAPSAARTITLPNNTGTVALTSDIPDVSGKIDTAGTGLSKSGTTLNHSNSVTAQTTQAVYPIKIDAQGHISAYGTAVTIPTVPSAGTTASAVGTSSSGGSATTWSKSDHVHSISSSTITSALGYTPYNSTNPSGYTTNTGTVTKVTAGTGLAIGTTAQGNFTTTGTINHTNSVTAQTTQAVYPIKIDAQGHISGYGTAVTIPTVPSAGTTASAVGTSSSGGSATTWSKSDHVHNITSATITSALGYTPYNGTTNPNGYVTTAGTQVQIVRW